MRVKIDMYNETDGSQSVIPFSDRTAFIVDCYPGLPSEGQLSLIYDELPEYEVDSKILSSKYIKLDHVDRHGKEVKGIYPIKKVDSLNFSNLNSPFFNPSTYVVRVLFYRDTEHEMANINKAYCFRTKDDYLWFNNDHFGDINKPNYSDLPVYEIAYNQTRIKKASKQIQELQFDVLSPTSHYEVRDAARDALDRLTKDPSNYSQFEYDIEMHFILTPEKIEEKYDSTADTVKHILRINELIHQVSRNFLDRADKHDRSKLSPEEKDVFDKFTPKLKNSTYGSDEYKGFLKSMDKALKHHYEENKSHHPDLLPDGIRNMSLLDLTEMVVDWKAAGERHANGNILESLKINRKRFNMSDDLVKIFANTFKELGYINEDQLIEFVNWFVFESKLSQTKEINELEVKVRKYISDSIESGADQFRGSDHVSLFVPNGNDCSIKLICLNDGLGYLHFDGPKEQYGYIYKVNDFLGTGYKYDQNVKMVKDLSTHYFTTLAFRNKLKSLDIFGALVDTKMIGI